MAVLAIKKIDICAMKKDRKSHIGKTSVHGSLGDSDGWRGR